MRRGFSNKMRPLWTFFAVAIAACHAHPLGQHGDYVYPAHPPPNPFKDDFSHRFHYKEYFPVPPAVSVGGSYLDGKLYADNHAYPSFSGKAEYTSSSIGQHFNNKPYEFKGTYSSYSDHLGGKGYYDSSALHDSFKGYSGDNDKFIYADGYGEYGHQGYDKLGAIAHGVRETLRGPISAVKNVQEGISDTISHAAKSVASGIGNTISSAVHTAQVAGSDLSDHLSRSAVHVQKGISGTITDTSYTAKTLIGILTEFLGKKGHIISDGARKQYDNTRHALSQATAVVARQIGRTALGVGEFLQNKAHEINVSIQKKVHRDDEHIPSEYDEPLKVEISTDPKKLEEFEDYNSGGGIGSSYAVSSVDPSVYGGAGGVAYGVQKSIVSTPQYVSAASYAKL